MATNLPSKPKVGTLQKPSRSFHTYPQKEVLQNSFLQHLLFVLINLTPIGSGFNPNRSLDSEQILFDG